MAQIHTCDGRHIAFSRAKIHRDIDSSLRIAEELQYYERLIISGMPKGLVATHRWTPGAGST